MTASRWRYVKRGLQLVLAIDIAVLVWFIGFRDGGSPPPVVTAPTIEQSGEVEVVATADVGQIHAVELRAQPNHRIMSLDAGLGQTTTTWPIPPGGVVYAIAGSPVGDQLALAYAADTSIDANGIHLLDSGDPQAGPAALVPELAGRYFTDLAYGPGGSVLWATMVERRDGNEQLSVVSIEVPGGAMTTVVTGAVDPAPGDGWVAYLPTGDDGARHSIERLDLATSAVDPIGVLDGRYDLDHLLAHPASGRLLVAALLDEGEAAITVGSPVGAHGNHAVPSQWLRVDPATSDVSGPLAGEPVIVWDATMLDGGELAFTTSEGLSVQEVEDGGPSSGDEEARGVLDGTPTRLIASQALRMIAG